MIRIRSVSRRIGFTIMEILISIMILMVGIVGVITLFPVAIRIGGEAVTDSLAANLARSVEESIRAAIKFRKVSYTLRGNRKFMLAYFIYEHDGIYNPQSREVQKDPVPGDPLDVLRLGGSNWDLDCVVLLPCDVSAGADPDGGYGGTSMLDARRRAYLSGKVFVYPEGDPEESRNRAPANGHGDPSRADDDKDDFELDHTKREVVEEKRASLVAGEEWPLRVTKTYRFGPKVLRSGSAAGRGSKEPAVPKDPYRTYSYAFAIRRAFEDGNVAMNPRRYAPANDLFEVKVMIFRAFMPETKQAYPIYTTTFLVSR